MAARTKVFISYSHADRRFLDRLHVFLKPLEHQHLVDWWDDTRLKPGVDWRKEIEGAMDTAKVAVLLVSGDFQASDFIRQHELPRLLKAAEQDHAVILQVFLGPINLSTWDVARFQAVNNPGRPLGKLRTKADRDEVWVLVSAAIDAALKANGARATPGEEAAEQTAPEAGATRTVVPPRSDLGSHKKSQRPASEAAAGPPPDDEADAPAKEVLPTAAEPEHLIPPESHTVSQPVPSSRVLRLWWRLVELWDEFKSCRLSLIALIISYLFFIPAGQGTEVLQILGEGTATGRSYWFLVSTFFFALTLSAICNWYTARVLFYFDFPGVRRPLPSTASLDNAIDILQTLLPRLLGVAPFVLISFGFLVAANAYDPGTSPRFWMHRFAGICAVLAVVFYLLLVWRRRWVGKMPARELQSFRELDRGRFLEVIFIGGIICLFSLLFFVAFTLRPVTLARHLGPGAIVFFALSSWVTIGSFLVFLSSRWQYPAIGAAIACALLFSFWNDNHIIRKAPAQEVSRLDVIQSFRQWYALAEKNDGVGTRHPLFVVATEGGGIRSAYWTALVLGALQDANPDFAPHVFAISGVSGGSLGGAVFDALLAEPNPGSFRFQDKTHDLLGQDFLSPGLAAMLYPDFVQRFLPFPIPYFDRGRALEMGWEEAWRGAMGNNRLADSFVDLWKPGAREWIPSLFLNGTSVETGNRIITSNLRLTTAFLDAEDAAQKLGEHRLPATQAACHIPLSTAIHMSYRLPPISPAGRFPNGSRILDGSFFENSGAVAAMEIVTRIKDVCRLDNITNVEVKVIMISNDPSKGAVTVAPAGRGPEPRGPKRTKSRTTQGSFLSEITAPLYTLLNARHARGIYAQKTIAREQRRFKAGETVLDPSATKDLIYFGLCETSVPLPSGLILSAGAARAMHEQLYLDNDFVRNGEAMNEVLKSLPAPTP